MILVIHRAGAGGGDVDEAITILIYSGIDELISESVEIGPVKVKFRQSVCRQRKV